MGQGTGASLGDRGQEAEAGGSQGGEVVRAWGPGQASRGILTAHPPPPQYILLTTAALPLCLSTPPHHLT